MNIIIAPHPDDELIGCSSSLINNKIHGVVYVERISSVRMSEAKLLCNMYDLWYKFLDGDIKLLLEMVHRNTYYIPSPEDNHPLHKLVYYLMFREYKHLVVYSTQMRDYFVREVENPLHKKSLLDKYYPSQKSLWEFDHKYFLFEGCAKI